MTAKSRAGTEVSLPITLCTGGWDSCWVPWCMVLDPTAPTKTLLSVNEAKLLKGDMMRHILFNRNAGGTPHWNIFKSDRVTQPQLPLLCFYFFIGLEASIRRPSGVFLTKGRSSREREKLLWDRFSHGIMIRFLVPRNSIPFSIKPPTLSWPRSEFLPTLEKDQNKSGNCYLCSSPRGVLRLRLTSLLLGKRLKIPMPRT